MKDEGRQRELSDLKFRLGMLEERVMGEISALRSQIEKIETSDVIEPSAVEPIQEEKKDPVMPPPLPVDPASGRFKSRVAWETVSERPKEEARVEANAEKEIVPPPVRKEEEAPFELRFGRVWLVRIGIGLLLTGLVLLGNFAYRNWIRDLPNGVRLAGLFLCSFILVEAGRRLAKKAELKAFGEVVLAGGLAFFYYCVFAGHHVARLQVIESPVIAALLLAAAAGVMAGVSWVRQAKGTAMLGLILASYAVMLQPLGWMSCVSGLLIAGAGCFFMSKPGWNAPGWVSLVASYASFAGWQLLGAADTDARAVALWFLPCTWAMFALPCVLGRLAAAMSGRAKAWFSGTNNGLFLLFFSALWIQHHGEERYWLVCAVIGVVWLILGMVGRGRMETAGGVGVSQALACLSLALVLKLDGWQLGLSLAGKSLGLAWAFAKFRGRSEMAFAVLTGVAASFLVANRGISNGLSVEVPAWSGALASMVLAGSSFVLWRGVSRCEAVWQQLSRPGAAVVFGAAMFAGLASWWTGVEEAWQGTVAIGVAAGMGGLSLVFDRQRRWVEPALCSLGWLCVGAVVMVDRVTSPMAPAIAAGVALITMALWRHLAKPDAMPPAAAGHWLSAFVAAWSVAIAIRQAADDTVSESLGLSLAGAILVALGAVMRCGALGPAGALLGIAAVAFSNNPGMNEDMGFLIVLGNLVGLGALVLPVAARRFEPIEGISLGLLARLGVFLAWCSAWIKTNPGSWGDWLALSAVALMLAARGLRRSPPVEALLLFGIGLAWWLANVAANVIPAEGVGIAWHGWGVLAASLLLVMQGGSDGSKDSDWKIPEVEKFVCGLFCLIASVWVTRLTLMAEGWRPVTVSWTVLGFLFVSAGLWREMIVLRMGGFILLGLALIKVFAVDVWEFNAFMRVVSFIVLGIAMLLLGLFYHRFAPMLKKLIEGTGGSRKDE